LQPAESDADQLRPAILESCFHVLAAALPVDATDGDRGDFYLPTRIARVRVAATHTSPVWGYASFDTDREPGAPELTGTVRLLDEAGRAVVEMLGVKFRRVGHEVHRDVRDDEEGWLYELRWSARARSAESSIVESPVPSRRGGWLVFADSGGVGEALAAFLSGRNERCVLVRPGDAYERIDGQRFRIRPENRDDLRRLLAAATAPDGLAHRGVVHLWSLDADAPESMTVATLESAQTLGCGSVLGLVQELAQGAWPVPPSLWLVTRGAQPIGAEPVPLAVAQAPLWGLGRVIAAEHPALWGGLVDLDPRAPAPAAAALLGEEISVPDPERQLAFRDGARHVARLVRRPRSGQRRPALSWRVNGSYLITGGLGDLGLAVARWAVEQGARRLVLIGRTALPPRARWSGLPGGTRLARQVAAVRELEALGASVHVAAVDVGDEGRLASFVEEFRRESWPPIRGVVHVAGVLEDRLLQQLDGEALRAVLRPKVIGGWLLHRLLEDTPLDFFVLFSSAGSLLGQPGQGNYAAANAFLDALAHHRRADSRPALTVNWGAWEDLGFAATPGGRRLAQHAAAQGIASIPPRQGLRVLERLLKEGATQAVVLPVDWPRYRERHPAGAEPPLLSELPDGEAGATPTADGPRDQGRLSGDLLRAADPQQRAQLLESYLRDHVARALGLSASQLDVHQPLNTMGLDSLMAVQVKNRVEVDLGVPVPVISFFAGASVAQLAGQVLAGLITASSRSGTSRVRVGNAEELLANIAELPDAQVEKLLSALLDDQDD
jgi:NAD(P)-dependent dehydrogenase (short-subunit alcohol dehydrogenase family)